MTTARTDTSRGFAFADARARYGLYAICFGFFLVLLDTTALNVAIVAMQREFSGTMSGLQWVVNSYTVVFAGFLLTCGAIGDRYGARRLYLVGLALFTGMSLLCALSPGVGFLIAMRMLQGLGAAIMLPASLALLSHAFPQPDEKARAVAFWASIVSLGFAAGPALGGVLTHFLGWRSIFWLNVPVGLLAFTMVRRFVDETKVPNPRHIDWAGQSAITLALFALTYALIDAGTAGWTAPSVLAAFTTAVVAAGVFAFIERASTSPVLPSGLFQNRSFSIFIATGFILNFGNYGILFIESIYLQSTRHLDALTSGLIILPFTALPTITTRLIVAYSGRRYIKWRLTIGHLFSAVGAAALSLAFFTPGYGAILLGFGLMGIGMGCIMPAMTAGVLSSAPPATSGLASGVLNSSRQVGGTIGVALMGTLVQSYQAHGYLWCYALIVLSFLGIAAVTLHGVETPAAGN